MIQKWLGLDRRCLEPEQMDDLTLGAGLHEQALRGLERINRWSFAAEALWKPLKAFYGRERRPLRVLDMACGGGDTLRGLAQRTVNENIPLVFEGCDFNPQAVDYARRRSAAAGLELSFFRHDALKDPLPERFDALLSSLFLHHLSDEDILSFFRAVMKSRVRLALFCDLRRSLSGELLCYAGTRLLSRSAIVHHDGLQSVRAALTPAEILLLAEKADLDPVHLRTLWPQRYLLEWKRR